MDTIQQKSNSRLGRNPFQKNEKIITPATREEPVLPPEETAEEKLASPTPPADSLVFESPTFKKVENFLVKTITLAIFTYSATRRAIEILKSDEDSTSDKYSKF